MKTVLITLCSITLLAMFMRLDVCQVGSTTFQDTSKPDFHFEIIDEQISGDEYPMSNAKILIDRKDYSKANLEHLFRWYSAMHARKGELLKVLVFTSKVNLLAERQLDEIEFIRKFNHSYKPKESITIQRSGAYYDAFFRRMVSNLSDTEEINELYTYLPNLDQPDITATIVIKGRDPWP